MPTNQWIDGNALIHKMVNADLDLNPLSIWTLKRIREGSIVSIPGKLYEGLFGKSGGIFKTPMSFLRNLINGQPRPQVQLYLGESGFTL